MNTRFGSNINSGDGVQPFVTTSYPSAYKHTIYLKNLLEHPEEMISAIDIMDNAGEQDLVQIYINSGGGAYDSLGSLLFAMKRCAAHIHSICSGVVASAATAVLVSSDTFELDPYTQLLFHNASFGAGGEGQDVLEYANFQFQRMKDFFEDTYSHLFSDEEIYDIVVNKRQKFMTAQEFIERHESSQMAMDEPAPLNPDVLNKVRKADLIRFIQGEVVIQEDGSVVEIDDLGGME